MFKISGADLWKTLGVEICLFYFSSLSHSLLQSVKVLSDMAVILFFTTVQTAFERWRKHPYILYALRPILLLLKGPNCNFSVRWQTIQVSSVTHFCRRDVKLNTSQTFIPSGVSLVHLAICCGQYLDCGSPAK